MTQRFKLNKHPSGVELKLARYKDADEFHEHCHDWLMVREDLNNGLINLGNLLSQNQDIFQQPYWFGGFVDTKGIVGCAMHARPDGLVLSDMPDLAVNILVRNLSAELGSIDRVLGPTKTAQYFAKNWGREIGVCPQAQSEWNVYRVDTIAPLSSAASGRLRQGTVDDTPLVHSWGTDYGEERPSPVDVPDYLSRKLKNGDLYVWENQGPRTILTISGRIGKGVRVSAVYTPPQHRGNGFASAALQEICRRMKSDGFSYVTLSVLINDPAERVYQKLGFHSIGQRAAITFSVCDPSSSN